MSSQYTLGMSRDPRANMQNTGARVQHGLGAAGGSFDRAQGAQYGALGMYRDAAMGQGPSQAQALMQQTGDRDMARQMQMQAMGRGGDLSGAARAATTAGLASQAQTQQQLGAMAAAEQQAAMQGYAGLGTQMAGQALQQQGMYEGVNQGMIGLQLQDDIARREAAQRAREARTARNLGWSQFGLNVGGSALEAIGLGGGMGG